jgi:hypothetical protein
VLGLASTAFARLACLDEEESKFAQKHTARAASMVALEHMMVVCSVGRGLLVTRDEAHSSSSRSQIIAIQNID